jgi:hypothetical protein
MKKVKAKTNKQKANGVDSEAQASKYTTKTTLDQVWGKSFSKFKPSDPTEYAEALVKLTRFDLQQECIKVGLVPHDDKAIMIHRLKKECQRAHDANTASSVRPKQIVIKSEGARQILNKAAAL